MTALAALALVGSAHAQVTVDIQFDQAQADELGIDTTEAERELSAALAEQLKTVDQSGFLTSMADAAGVAGKGIGVDYATNPETFVVGFSLGTGANASGLVFGRGESTLPEAGFALQASAMAGLNLGVLSANDSPLDRFVVSVHGMALRGAEREFRGSMYNLGGHVQAKIVGKATAGVFEWGGLDLTSGFERTRYALKLSSGLPLTTDLDNGSLTWDATGAYEIVVTDDSVPIELSTNLRVLVFTLFLGGAADWHTGAATSSASLSGPVTGTVGSDSARIGTASVTIDDEGVASPVSGRFFTGFQVNILPVKVYFQVNLASTASVGAHAGLRVAL